MNNEVQELSAGTGSTACAALSMPKPLAQHIGKRFKQSRKNNAGLEQMAQSLIATLGEQGGRGMTLSKLLAALEREALVVTLRKFNGHQHKTALYLGLKPTTLCVKLQKYGVVIRRLEVDIRYPAASF